MPKLFRQLKPVEKIVVVFLLIVALLSATRVVRAFYDQHSEIIPEEGGIYTEGMVGKIGALNPLFVHQGSISADITQLVFSGLTRFNPETGSILPDLADFTVSDDGKEYTFVIKEGATWHDGTPVTSQDVVFTYETVIKNPEFNGVILSYNDYSGMRVLAVDERTVKFLLEKSNSFFLVKTLTGVLPSHLLNNIGVPPLGEASFNTFPIGSGRYRFISMAPVNDYLEVSLEAFENFYGEPPHIKNLLFKIFASPEELGKHLGEVDGVRQIPEVLEDKIFKKETLIIHRYHLPQYVAVFINTESPLLKDKKVRLALQLGTDKERLLSEINETQIIDTPLLEIDQENWMHQYSVKKANGALFDTEWKLPDKNQNTGNRTQETEEKKTQEEPTFINGPNGGRDFKTTENKITFTGLAPARTKAIFVNDYELKKFVPGEKAWSYVANAEFGNLKAGENIYEIFAVDFNEAKKLLDSITVTFGDATALAQEAKEERSNENEEAEVLPTRLNTQGEPLRLRLITSETPVHYQKIAEILKKQWSKIGVELEIYVLEPETFEERLTQRDYDLLLFGQNLGYNLDAYPYWHSSQAKQGGFNLSQFKSFAVDSLLQEARLKNDEKARKRTLNGIQRILSHEVPAIFLYSPTYSLALGSKIQNTSFENLATSSDRFAAIEKWYARGKRQLKEGAGFFTFFGWVFKQF